MERAARRALLALMGGDGGAGAVLSETGWLRLDAMAHDHRIRPLLHTLYAGRPPDGLPPDIAANWRQAHRQAAIDAMAQGRARGLLVETLRAVSIEPVFLKGSWLALHAYRDPAARPMRDLDILVDPGRARMAWEALLAADYLPAEPLRHDFETLVSAYHHLPLLVGPDGIEVELHTRLWSRPDDPLMPQEPEGLGQGIERCDGLAFLSPEHLFAHLVVHAVHVHSLDAGPLALTDIAYLARARTPDWAAIWRDAEAGGWDRAASLLLALADRWVAPGMLADSECPHEVPADMLELAPELLLQPLAQRHRAIMLAGLGGAAIPQTRAPAGRRWADPRWIASRAMRLAGAVSDNAARRRAKSMRALHDWLGSD